MLKFLPNILPAHPEAPEWVKHKTVRRAGPVTRLISRLKKWLKQRRNLTALRAETYHRHTDIGLQRSGLRAAAKDRAALNRAT